MALDNKQTFVAPIDNFVRVSLERMAAVHKEATKRTIDIAQTPMAKGGRMRIDTGFLRASGQVSLTGMPTGPTRGNPDDGKNVYQSNEPQIAIVIAGAKLGSTIFFGWTAAYALARESKDAFLRLAVQQWPQTVARVTEELKQRIK